MKMIYSGPSMNPLLKAGDCLEVIPYVNRKIHSGDVVIFKNPQKEHYVVHRVISINLQGVKTKGDNNHTIDPWILSPDDICGQVVNSIKKNKKKLIIHGSLSAKILARVLRLKKMAVLTIFKIFRPGNYFLSKEFVGKGLLSGLVKTQVVYFHRPEGIEIQLILGHRVIGRSRPGNVHWKIRRLFRLLVNERTLPNKSTHYLK